MTKSGDVSINIGIEVSEETVQRCCQLLQMYLQDHPEKIVKSNWSGYPGSNEYEYFPMVYIAPKEEGQEE